MTAVVPAQLAFLAIYNPELGRTDETFRDQVVYWYSRSAKEKRKDGAKLQEEENEKLRQIGLAQGMVDFAKSFANRQPVDSIDTEKSRIILRELESDWWILASIDLTKIPSTAQNTSKNASDDRGKEAYEYSSREVSPAPLLLQQVIDGHRTFLLHNGAALSRLFYKLSRQKFCGLLERFWNRFAQNWDVLLHGNPAVEVFGGLKLAAGGELGMGVGEEEWGSGEREVLEDYARRTDGLVDLMVSRFGEPSISQTEASSKQGMFGRKKLQNTKELDMWLGAGNHAQTGDGMVFSGVGALSRASLRDISRWTQDIYAYGDLAYGVGIHPSNDRRKRKRRQPALPSNEHAKESAPPAPNKHPTSPRVATPPGIPPPIFSAAERSLERAISSHDVRKAKSAKERKDAEDPDSAGWTQYLKLGYGTAWGPSASSATSPFKREDSATLSESTEHEQESATMRQMEPVPDIDPEIELEERLKTQVRLEDNGHFLIGLKGELTDESHLQTDDEDDEEWNQRTLLRTLHVEVLKSPQGLDLDTTPLETPRSFSSLIDTPQLSRLRVIVYVHRPFIYTFLFHPQTESLSFPAFYRNLHTFFAPLHKPLSVSTSPVRVASRIAAAASVSVSPSTTPVKPDDKAQQPIFDLVYDPRNFTIHATVPNIPLPGSLAAEGLSFVPGGSIMPEGWTRAEALNVHSAILEIVRSTRSMPGLVGEGGERELERSIKTGRGWWVVWMRLDDEAHLNRKKGDKNDSRPHSPSMSEQTSKGTARESLDANKDYFAKAPSTIGHRQREAEEEPDNDIDILADSREAILVRRARDATPMGKSGKSRGSSALWSLGMGGAGTDTSGKDAGSGWGPARLAEGVGVDARKYVEGLLSLNR